MSAVQVLDDPIGFIRKKPGMFTRSSPVSGVELATNIVSEALLLIKGKGRVTTFLTDTWWVVASDIDWIANESEHPVEDVFSHILPLPQAGPNSMRGEVLLTAFARDVITQSIDGQHVVKGSVHTSSNLWPMLISQQGWKRVVAFRMEDI